MTENSSGKTLKEQIYDAIFEDVVKGKYLSGDILREKDLVERYKASKSPVREALVQLCGEGILLNRPRYGYEVIRLTKNDIEQILRYRLIVEGGALQSSINSITKEQLDKLRDINKKCSSQEAKGDFWIHWKYNMEFHLQLMSCYDNEFAYNNLKKAMETLTRAYAQLYWDKWNNITSPKDTKIHGEIIKCLRKKDLDEALALLKKDIEYQEFRVV